MPHYCGRIREEPNMAHHSEPTSMRSILRLSIRAGAATTLLLLLGGTASSQTAQTRPIPELTIEADRDYADANSFRSTVRFSDLDVSSTDGRRALQDRITVVARQGCGNLYRGEPPVTTLRPRFVCTRMSVDQAMTEVDRLVQTASIDQASVTAVAVVASR